MLTPKQQAARTFRITRARYEAFDKDNDIANLADPAFLPIRADYHAARTAHVAHIRAARAARAARKVAPKK